MKKILTVAAAATLVASTAMAGTAPTEYEAPVDDAFVPVPVAKGSALSPAASAAGIGVLAIVAIVASSSSD